MATEIGTSRPVDEEDLSQVYRIASKLVSILGTLVFMAFAVILLLVGGFIYALFGSRVAEGYTRGEAATRIQELVLGMWDKLLPITQGVFRVVAPILIISLALLLLRILSRHSASPFNLARVTTDLPSTLAILIIAALCVLPLSGLGVPEVLGNIALVVVGFYFGERRRRENDLDPGRSSAEEVTTSDSPSSGGPTGISEPPREEGPYEETNAFGAGGSGRSVSRGVGESAEENEERGLRRWESQDDARRHRTGSS